MAYKSPIEAVFSEVKTAYDDAVVRAVHRVQINVDKDELLKALQYDRDQYNQGYVDGYGEGLIHAEEALKAGAEGEVFKEGQYVVYTNGYKCQIGRIKSITENGAFVAYHEGETAALTDLDRLLPIQNDYCITKTTLGGGYFVPEQW